MSSRNFDYGQIIGENIRHYRLLFDQTQKTLAEESDITVGHLSRIERGYENLRVSTLVQIAKALGVPPMLLFVPPDESPSYNERVRKKES